MAWEGMITEALAICRGVHERYHPSKRNPWNEIECGDHYARAMASWGVLLSLAGFEYDGPAATIGFAPRLTPEDFQCALRVHRREIKWGRLGRFLSPAPRSERRASRLAPSNGGAARNTLDPPTRPETLRDRSNGPFEPGTAA
jgi:hypothetical protein